MKLAEITTVLLICFCQNSYGVTGGTREPLHEDSKDTTFGSENKPDIRTEVVHTKYGKVQGRIYDIRPKFGHGHRKNSHQMLPDVSMLPKVKVFKGIPYATPPVGSNR